MPQGYKTGNGDLTAHIKPDEEFTSKRWQNTGLFIAENLAKLATIAGITALSSRIARNHADSLNKTLKQVEDKSTSRAKLDSLESRSVVFTRELTKNFEVFDKALKEKDKMFRECYAWERHVAKQRQELEKLQEQLRHFSNDDSDVSEEEVKNDDGAGSTMEEMNHVNAFGKSSDGSHGSKPTGTANDITVSHSIEGGSAAAAHGLPRHSDNGSFTSAIAVDETPNSQSLNSEANVEDASADEEEHEEADKHGSKSQSLASASDAIEGAIDLQAIDAHDATTGKKEENLSPAPTNASGDGKGTGSGLVGWFTRPWRWGGGGASSTSDAEGDASEAEEEPSEESVSGRVSGDGDAPLLDADLSEKGGGVAAMGEETDTVAMDDSGEAEGAAAMANNGEDVAAAAMADNGETEAAAAMDGAVPVGDALDAANAIKEDVSEDDVEQKSQAEIAQGAKGGEEKRKTAVKQGGRQKRADAAMQAKAAGAGNGRRQNGKKSEESSRKKRA